MNSSLQTLWAISSSIRDILVGAKFSQLHKTPKDTGEICSQVFTTHMQKSATESSQMQRSTYFIDTHAKIPRGYSCTYSIVDIARNDSDTCKALISPVDNFTSFPFYFGSGWFAYPGFPGKEGKINDKWFKRFLPVHTSIWFELLRNWTTPRFCVLG